MIRKVSALCLTLAIVLCMVLPFTVSATDPYNTYYSWESYDGGVFGQDAVYATAHDAATGVVVQGTLVDVGQRLDGADSRVDRDALYFNTADLKPEDTIESVTLQIWVESDHSDVNFDITVIDSSGVNGEIEDSDYHILHDAVTDLGHVNTLGISTAGYTTITLNAVGKDAISKDAWTELGLRSSRDITPAGPAGDEYVTLYSGESSHPPILTVTYSYSLLGIPESRSISKVQVYSNFKEVGDELFIWRNTLSFHVAPEDGPQGYFQVELQDAGGDVVGQTVVQEWDYSPLSIYLSAAQVTTSGLFWRDACTLVMTANALYTPPAGFTDFEYEVQAEDWIGLSGPLLDSWVKSTTNWLEGKAGVTKNSYLTSGTGGTWCLDPDEPAQVMFIEGIPYIDVSRPNLFLIGAAYTASGDSITGTYGHGIFEDIWGDSTTYWGGALADLGAGWGLGGQAIMGMIAGVVIIVIGALVRSKTNDPNISLILMIVAVVIACALGSIALDVVLLGTVALLYLLLHNQLLSRT